MNHQKKHFNKELLIENMGSDDDFLKMLLELYFNSFSSYLETIKDAIFKNDIILFKKTIHSIKGSSSTLCFEIMSDFLEHLGKIDFSHLDKIFGLITKIEKEYNYLIVNLRNN